MGLQSSADLCYTLVRQSGTEWKSPTAEVKQMAEKVYKVRFTVEGRGAFPIDMLRYDASWPISELDSAVLVNPAGTRKVTLAHCDSGKAPVKLPIDVRFAAARCGLTPARWESFGWRIVSVEVAS